VIISPGKVLLLRHALDLVKRSGDRTCEKCLCVRCYYQLLL